MFLRIETEMNEIYEIDCESLERAKVLLNEWLENHEDGSTPLYEITLSF